MSIRVLIVDDSPTMRAILRRQLSREADIEVVGTANDAAEGRQMIKQLNPDVVTLDIEMPGMNGLDFLEKIMTLRPMPVIIVSGHTSKGCDISARALAIGAIECYSKPTNQNGTMDDGGLLAELVREAAQAHVRKPSASSAPIRRVSTPQSGRRDIDLIAIGSSTGGVEALHEVLSHFPADCPPTVVVQHVGTNFLAGIARSLNECTAANVRLAESMETLLPGNIYLAPGGEKHLGVTRRSQLTAKIIDTDKVEGHRPSVDVLFHTVAEIATPRTVGVILTGIGRDGAAGLLRMRQAGAHTIAQDEKSCVVFGMPRSAIALGAAAEIQPLNKIGQCALGVAS